MANQDIGAKIALALQEYTKDVTEAIEREADTISKETVDELKNSSPKKTGEYAKGWAKKKQGKNIVIYNKDKPQLTHLLEKGHAKRGGGRVAGRPHIRPAEEKLISKFEQAVEKVIREGG